MSEMTEANRSIVAQESMVDELARNRVEFEFSADILSKQCAYPYSIWAEPNSTVRSVIVGEIDYNTLPYDAKNETEKGMFFQEQAEFVAAHQGQAMLCEALGAEACKQTACPLFIPAVQNRHNQPLCREWKIIFPTTR